MFSRRRRSSAAEVKVLEDHEYHIAHWLEELHDTPTPATRLRGTTLNIEAFLRRLKQKQISGVRSTCKPIVRNNDQLGRSKQSEEISSYQNVPEDIAHILLRKPRRTLYHLERHGLP